MRDAKRDYKIEFKVTNKGLMAGAALLLCLVPLSNGAQSVGNKRSLASVQPEIRVQHAKELLGTNYSRSVVKLAESDQNLQNFIYVQTKRLLKGHWREQALDVSHAIIEESRRHGFDPIFVMAIINHESMFNPVALGRFGEIGLMQIKPDTAEWIAKKIGTNWDGRESLKDMTTNIRLGTAFLAHLRKSFKSGNSKHGGYLYMTAYNMGAAKLRQALDRDRLPKTYSTKVMQQYLRLYKDWAKYAKKASETERKNLLATVH